MLGALGLVHLAPLAGRNGVGHPVVHGRPLPLVPQGVQGLESDRQLHKRNQECFGVDWTLKLYLLPCALSCFLPGFPSLGASYPKCGRGGGA